MAMGNRPEVPTAPAPIAALDVSLLAQQLATALARVPFRRPFEGESSLLSNLGISVTREVIRSFMGYASSLRIPEFRSLELVLDEICQWIMPPFVRSLDVDGHPTEFGGVPGILYVPRQIRPAGRDPLPPRGRVHRHVADDVRLLHGEGVPGDRVRHLRRRLSAGAGVSLPRRGRGRLGRLRGARRPGHFAGADLPRRGFRWRWPGQHPAAGVPRAHRSRPARRTGAVLARGRLPPGRGIGDRKRGPRHPAVEHPHDRLSPWDRCRQPTGRPTERGLERVSPHLRHLGG